MGVCSLSDKERSHAQIDRRAVRIEGVACGHHHADNRLRATKVLQLEHQGCKYSLRRGRSSRNQNLLAKVTQQIEQTESRKIRNPSKNDNHEQERDKPD